MKRLAFTFFLLAASAAAQLLAPHPAPPPPKEKPADFGKWQLSPGKSSADGSPTLVATLEADRPVHQEDKEATPTLFFRFKDKSIDVYVSFGLFVASDSTKLLIIRGDQDPEEQTWTMSEDGTVAFGPDDAIALVRSFEGVDKVTFRINRLHHETVVATFSPKGVESVIDAILKTAAK